MKILRLPFMASNVQKNRKKWKLPAVLICAQIRLGLGLGLRKVPVVLSLAILQSLDSGPTVIIGNHVGLSTPLKSFTGLRASAWFISCKQH